MEPRWRKWVSVLWWPVLLLVQPILIVVSGTAHWTDGGHGTVTIRFDRWVDAAYVVWLVAAMAWEARTWWDALMTVWARRLGRS